MPDASIAILGGGPAGAATALTLAKRGVKARVFEGAPGVRHKVGETIPPNAHPLLGTLGLSGGLVEPRHLLCHGNRFLWGGDEITEKLFFQHTQGHGWHLDRTLFEEDLQRLVLAQNQKWTPNCRFLGLERRGGSWLLDLDQAGKSIQIEADFVVDACGRAAPLARTLGLARQDVDRLIGITCVFQLAPNHQVPQYTHIEAVAQGWWYAALLPGDRLMVAHMTDADLLDRDHLTTHGFAKAARQTSLLAPLLAAATSQTRVLTRPASSSRLERVAGDGWLAVGDAALAYDPVSSYGLTSALGSGIYAGHAISDHLAGRNEALPAYVAILEQTYALYLDMVGQQYQLEQRWPERPFWQRRNLASFAIPPRREIASLVS